MNKAMAVILLLLLSGMLPGCVSSQASRPAGYLYLEPTPVPVTSFKVSGKEYRFEKEGLVIVVAHLGQEGIESYYAGQGLINPLTILYPLLKPTLFVVRIENHTRKILYFNPSMSGVVDNDGKPYVNRDITDFYPYLGNDNERAARMAALRATLFDTQVRLVPGASVERLMAFDAIGAGVRRVKLVLRDLYVGDLPLDIPFLFSCQYRYS